MGLRHRKEFRGGCFFVTTSVIKHIRVFEIPDCAEAIMDSLRFYSKKYHIDIAIYVVMPSHLHMILTLSGDTSLSAVMRDFKKYTSIVVKKILTNNAKYSNLLRIFRNCAPRGSSRSFKLWQDRFDDVGLVSERVYLTKYQYILYNPVKAGLCDRPEDYRWSSFYQPDANK
jgi:REP element-mobilizing transposase RayT